MVQIFFSFVSNSLSCYYHTLPYAKTKEKKIWSKNKIEPQHIHQLLYFLYITWGETVLWGALFIIKTLDRMQCYTVLKHKLQSLNIQDDRSTRGLLAKPLKKFQNHLYGQPVESCGVFEWTSIELRFNIIKNLSRLFFI